MKKFTLVTFDQYKACGACGACSVERERHTFGNHKDAYWWAMCGPLATTDLHAVILQGGKPVTRLYGRYATN